MEGQPDPFETLAKYCPHKPWPRQLDFLGLDHVKEVLYGGAAGPGKTDALLMAALMYVDTPGYAALILRRDFPRLSMPGSIMDRARQWLYNVPGVSWNGSEHNFRFPSGAVLQFGYIDSPDDRFRYQSAEFQFIAFEEATEFRLTNDESNPYLYMFSRCRQSTDIGVPERIRAASNPGNIGHMWVRNYFMTAESLQSLQRGEHRIFYMPGHDGQGSKAFVPALLKDNPSIDAEAYTKNLERLPPILRARLLNGDWSVSEGSLIDPDWFRYYDTTGDHLRPRSKAGEQLGTWDCRRCYRFATVDTAGTEKQIVEAKKRSKASWSCVAVWDVIRVGGKSWLCLRHVWRDQVAYVGLRTNIRRLYKEWNCRLLVENAHFGPALVSDLQGEVPCELISAAVKTMGIDSGKTGKVERASELMIAMSEGRVFLPLYENSWKLDYESELLAWTGDPDEPADQIDVSSHAARHVQSMGGGGAGMMLPLMAGRLA